jgi:uncharacterized Zn-finger protein
MRIIAFDKRSTSAAARPQRDSGSMTPSETITIDAMVAACDGGGALGHPLVYLNLAPLGRVECPYCSRLFVNPGTVAAGAERAAGEAPAPSG